MDPAFLNANYDAHGVGSNAAHHLIGDSCLASYPSPQLSEALRLSAAAAAAAAAAGTAIGPCTESLAGHINSRSPAALPGFSTFPSLEICDDSANIADQKIGAFGLADIRRRGMTGEENANELYSRIDTTAAEARTRRPAEEPPPGAAERPCYRGETDMGWEPSDEDLDVCVELDRAWDEAEKPLDDRDITNGGRFDLNQASPVSSQKRQRDSVCSSNDVQDGCLSDTACSGLRVASNEDSRRDTRSCRNGADDADDGVKRDTGRRAERKPVFPPPEGQVSRENRRWRSAPPRLAERNPLHHVRHTKLDVSKQSFTYGSRTDQELHYVLQGLIERLQPAVPVTAVVAPATLSTADAEKHAADEANFDAEVDAAVTAMSAEELEQMDMRLIMEVDDCWLRENARDD
ncbi:unnamed protein product [Closterium sp. NIES-53]